MLRLVQNAALKETLRSIVWSRKNRFVQFALMLVGALVITLLSIHPGVTWKSHYAVTNRAPFNQLTYYPIKQTLPADLYRPIAPWSGRLILPDSKQQGNSDWVWIEIHNAPSEAQELVGKRVRLEWSQNPETQRDVAAVVRDVRFTPEVKKLQYTTGNLYPVRLNGRSQVGPLQAMAGSRPIDDVTVTLTEPVLSRRVDGSGVLQIKLEPMLDTGRYYTLVKILGTVSSKPEFTPKACPGALPCPSELFRVQHYNPKTGQFDGQQETVRIPQQPVNGFGVYSSTPRTIEKSPAGTAGWYLYGAQDKAGLFTVQAIKPKSLFQLQPQQVLLDQGEGFDYIHTENWKNTEQRKGTIQTVLIDSKSKTSAEAIAQWKEGDRALVMHLFGGRGGKSGEGSSFGTVTGHFAYGLAEVVREPLANELQLVVNYRQVYATNIQGVISGRNSWTNYMGNQQLGWLGTRPVSDVLVKLDAIAQDYDFGGNKLSPFSELSRQLRIITDRYRVGDGTGTAKVTPATSCVQDSNQALFLTIQSIREQVESSPEIQSWWSSHPNDPTVKRFEQLIALGNDLETQLTPIGIVRQDWKSNVSALAGTQIRSREFVTVKEDENILTALKSWRTILPREAHDELSLLFLRHGAQLWFLQTNQVGGDNPDIFPIAPTQPFALWTLPGTTIPIVTILLTRILGAVKLSFLGQWFTALGILCGYAAIALPIGLSQRFLQFRPWRASSWQYRRLLVRLFFMPALVEEFVFRVLMLPAPRAGVTELNWTLWAVFSLLLFIVYHPINAKTFYKQGDPTFFDPTFLVLTGLLGFACTVAYLLTGSLLIITLIHWVAVTAWLTLFGGMEKLHPQRSNMIHADSTV